MNCVPAKKLFYEKAETVKQPYCDEGYEPCVEKVDDFRRLNRADDAGEKRDGKEQEPEGNSMFDKLFKNFEVWQVFEKKAEFVVFDLTKQKKVKEAVKTCYGNGAETEYRGKKVDAYSQTTEAWAIS